MKAHAFKRMQEGLRKILSCHTAVELSSICGCLQLKTQQKASTSMDQIMKYATETGELDETRINTILRFTWEGALWEYLHSIGHPVHTMVLDPKITIMKLWEHGGFLEGPMSFVPHFIAREVKKRNEWITSEDIQVRLDKIRTAQDQAKQAERRIVSEHDYTNILQYFNQMGNLRSLENNTREYLIAELEIARSRLDSYEDSTRFMREQQGEMERKFVEITDSLNARLAHTEFLLETETQKTFALEGQLFRLKGVLQSFQDSEESRQLPGGGSLQPSKMRGVGESPFSLVRELHEKLRDYRDARDRWDDGLRAQCRDYVEEIHSLRTQLAELTGRYNHLLDQYDKALRDLDGLTDRHVLLDRRDGREQSRKQIQTAVAWDLALKYQALRTKYEQEHAKVRPLLLAGCLSAQPLTRRLCHTLLHSLSGLIRGPADSLQLAENMKMSSEDFLSQRFEEEEKDRLYKLSLVTPKPGKGGKKPKTPSSSKKPAKADDQTVKTAKTDDSKGSKAKAPAKKGAASASRPTSASAKDKSPAKKTPAKKK